MLSSVCSGGRDFSEAVATVFLFDGIKGWKHATNTLSYPVGTPKEGAGGQHEHEPEQGRKKKAVSNVSSSQRKFLQTLKDRQLHDFDWSSSH